MRGLLLLLASLLGPARSQLPGTFTTERHPSLPILSCASPDASNCTTLPTALVLDASYRYSHGVGSYFECLSGDLWNSTLCPSPPACARNCEIEGNLYDRERTAIVRDSSVRLDFRMLEPFRNNYEQRVFVLDESKSRDGGGEYFLFKLKGKEVRFDVDLSKTVCGTDASVKLVAMDRDGGRAAFEGNSAGAAFGTGYCDASCPRDVLWIDGEANMLDFVAVESYRRWPKGTGKWASCCSTVSLWDSNRFATSASASLCKSDGAKKCTPGAEDCGCDAAGCALNPFRNGVQGFFGPGGTVDTDRPFTVVTQFPVSPETGELVAIRRFYVQDGKRIEAPKATVKGLEGESEINDGYCKKASGVFGEGKLREMGGLKRVGEVLDRGLVMALAITDDPDRTRMRWLDSVWPEDADQTKVGVKRGTCEPKAIGWNGGDDQYNSRVVFSGIRFGGIGSTV